MTWIRDVELAGGPFWPGAAPAVGLGAAALLTILARGERDSVSRRLAGFLRALRLMAAGLLACLLAEPVARRVVREPARGRVVVAVDLSDSMDTIDRGRPPAEAAKLAGLLKAGGSGSVPADDPAVPSRREIVRRLLDAPASPLGRLAEDHDLEFVAFAEAATPTARSGLLERLAAKSGTPADLAGNATDWRPVLEGAARPVPADAPPTVAVVLIGDGRLHPANGAGPARPGAVDPVAELARRKVPVFPLLIGSEAIPRDLAVADLTAPETAFLGDTAPVDARLEVNGFAGREVAATLEARPPGKPPIVAKRTILAATDRERPVVRFQVPLNAVGTVPLTVAVAPLSNEARLDNNAGGRAIEVTGEPARVLLIDGEPRWEFRYLRNALARDPRVKVEAVVLHQPTLELPADRAEGAPTFARTLPGADGENADDPLGRFDAVILGDVASADIPGRFWDHLESHVAGRGGTLIVVPGPRHWGEVWGKAGGDADRRSPSRPPPVAAALAPMVALRPAAIDETSRDPDRPTLPPGVAVVPTPEAAAEQSAWPMFRLRDGEATEDLPHAWADLPRQPWALTGRPKPGAIALAATAGASPGAVMASQRFGLGRVFWIGVDGTWRWRHRAGDALHHRFWGQTVRWACASARLTAGDDRVRFGATRPRVEAGEPVRVRARISEAVTDLPARPILAARVARLDGAPSETLVPLRPVAGLPRTFEGEAPPLAPGRYAIRLDAPGIGEDRGEGAEASVQVVPRTTGERVELAASRAHFEALANATGGRVVADFEADRLPDLLRPLAQTVSLPRARVVSLWDHPATLALFLAIVGTEWIARKRAGLP